MTEPHTKTRVSSPTSMWQTLDVSTKTFLGLTCVTVGLWRTCGLGQVPLAVIYTYAIYSILGGLDIVSLWRLVTRVCRSKKDDTPARSPKVAYGAWYSLGQVRLLNP